MKQRRILIAVFGLGLSLVLALGWIAWSGTRAAAQDTNPKPQGEFTLQRVPESNLNENAALGTAFTYQGYLEDGGKPAAGSYDFQFTPFGAASGGSPVGNTDTHGGVTVTDGLFAVDLDFGSNIFAGEGRWLEIAAKRAADANYTTLSPRQPLRPAPYALYATNADLLDGEHASAFAGASHDHWGATWSGSGRGLFLQSSDHEALHGYTQAGFGAGVVGRNADLGPGGFFSSTLGYGVWSQGAMADVALGGDHGVIASDIFFPQADISLFSHRNVVVHLDEWDDDANACFTIYSGPNSILAQWCEPGMMTSSGLINTVSETD
jgi:hypothetical protein